MPSGEATNQERTEQPTARRREEARRRGQVARSIDLSAAAALLGGVGMLALTGQAVMGASLETARRWLEAAGRRELTSETALTLILDAAVSSATIAWPIAIVPPLVGVACQLVQTRFTLSPAALTPRWSRLDPAQGLRRLVSARSVVELGKAVVKLVIVGGVAGVTLRQAWPGFSVLGQGGSGAVVPALAQVVVTLWLRIGLAYLALALVDYGYEWWRNERGLRMTREELREELRHTEGDPLLRSLRRATHRRLAARRMLQDVRRADVVVRNPIHYAVALRYDQRRMKAPTVVAKGARLIAQRIIEAARRHGVPVVDNPPLARALFRSVALGREVPPALYRVVAEVLAYVYSVRSGRS